MTPVQIRTVHVRAMRASDLDFAASCTAAEGWRTQTRAEFEGFYEHDAEGCLIAEREGTPLGICVATAYGGARDSRARQYGFVGELIVVPEARGQGIGRRLLEAAIAYLQGQGAESIYLDAVRAAAPWYERVGFRRLCRSLRFSGTVEGRAGARVRPMRADDLDAVCALDRRAFGADRRFFLERRWQRFLALGQVLERGGQLGGFVLATRVEDLVAAGPWVVGPEVPCGMSLIQSLSLAAPGCTLGLGVLETNPAAVQAVRALGLTEREGPPWRMVLGPAGDLGVSSLAYAIGSPAKG
jgi:ribosomal protein S18 acetylase RimI-like enzyme